jgi:hypothetical protein
VRLFREQGPLPYGPRHAAYDLKKLRGKQIVASASASTAWASSRRAPLLRTTVSGSSIVSG